MAAAGPPQVGIPVTKAALDSKIGANAQTLKKSTVALADLAEWGAAYTAEQLVDAFGFTLEEANLFKSALGEVASVVTAVDALAFLSQTWGA
jgi:NADH/NAD ratio-sensing transcriptional regulator Rex